MKNVAVNDRTKKLILFSLALAAVMGLVFFLGTSLVNAGVKQTVNSNAASLLEQTNTFISSNEILQEKLAALEELDKQYSSIITDVSFTSKADSLNKLILMEENNFRNATESAGEKVGLLADENIKESFVKMLAAYRLLIDNRKAFGTLRNTVALQSNTLAPDEKNMLRLQNEVMEKSNRIAVLESAARIIMKPKETVVSKNCNSGLLENINNLESKLASLTSSNSQLKIENSNLLKQQTDASKNSGSAEQLLKEKNISLQQKVEDLNAEIQLVKVDCNLSRVDATQIISNAKQRKQLLNEASDMLTGLSLSNNTIIKGKVRDKINRLNQVAANSRE